MYKNMDKGNKSMENSSPLYQTYNNLMIGGHDVKESGLHSSCHVATSNIQIMI